MTNDNNDALEMIYDVRWSKHGNGACVVSTSLQDGTILKRWVEPLEKQIELGSVGFFRGDNPDDGYVFEKQKCYWKTNYDLAVVRSVTSTGMQSKEDWCEYNIYSPKGGWRTLCSKICDYVTVGNAVLLGCGDKFIANLRTKENCYDLQHGRNLRQYGIAPMYNNINDNNIAGYKTLVDGKSVMPAVIYGYLIGNRFGKTAVFIPQYSEKVITIDILCMPGQPVLQPSDIVLLEKNADNNSFRLMDNLTQSLLNRKLNEQFKLEQHPTAMARRMQGCCRGNK